MDYLYTMSDPAAATATRRYHQASLSSLPDDVVLKCLVRVPRSHDRLVSCVSKRLKSLVWSPELKLLRSLVYKDSVYLCFLYNYYSFRWFRLSRSEKTTTNIDYQLVRIPIPSHTFMFFSSTAVVGSEIYFIGRRHHRSKNLWILDTESGQVRVGPSMKVARHEPISEVVDGKIYVIGGSKRQIPVEVFDPKSQSWEFATEEIVRCQAQFSASLEGKVYVVDHGKTWVYNPREGLSKEVITKKKRKQRNERRERVIRSGLVKCVWVVDNVLYAFFRRIGLMWFDTKLSEWRSLVICNDVKTVVMITDESKMAEYEGKLAFFWSQGKINLEGKFDIGCTLIALDRVGEEICGKMEWSGIVATSPNYSTFMHCLLVADRLI